MKCLFKNRHLKEKKREITKVGDDPISEGKTEEDTNYAFKSHDEQGEEDVRAGCCFFPRRTSYRTCRSGAEINLGDDDDDDDVDGVCYRSFSVPTEKHFSANKYGHKNPHSTFNIQLFPSSCGTYYISDENRKELNTDDDNDDDDDDGVCYRNFSLPKKKQISTDKCGFKISHSPSRAQSFVYKEPKVKDSDFRPRRFPSQLKKRSFLLNLFGSYTPDYAQDQKSNRTSIAGATIVSFVHEMEVLQEEQNTSHQYTDGKCGEIKFGSTDLTGKTSSPCKSTGLPEYKSERTIKEDGHRVSSPWIKNKSREADPPVMTKNMSSTNTLSPSSHVQFSFTDSCYLTRSHSVSSLTKTPIKNLIQAASLPDMRLKEFTPAIAADESKDETYLLQCSSAGLYQCSVTDLVFVMKGEGDVVYRIVPWNRKLLAQHHKKPAGPLFDIKCQQQSVCQLHLPHCEVMSTGAGQFLQVAHVNDEGIEFIPPHQITETHVVINITEFSGYGNVRDENSPCGPVRALVLLFYKPPVDPDLTSFLNVLLLPQNVVLQDVLHTRKKLYGDERYIDTSPHCKLHPNQVYTLSAVPEDDSVLVEPREAEFHEESYDNYFLSFKVILLKVMKMIRLNVSDSTSSHSVWNRAVYLSSSGVKKCRESMPWNLSPNERLLNVRSGFIDGISEPVLNSLLDKLLEKKVITDAELEAGIMQNRSDRARFVIDIVRKKGEAASSQMIEVFCDLDSYFCKSLGLI